MDPGSSPSHANSRIRVSLLVYMHGYTATGEATFPRTDPAELFPLNSMLPAATLFEDLIVP